MNVFISGGCKNGKSYYAQRIAKEMSEAGNMPLYYIATMRPTDDEDRARIRRHIAEREGWGFITIEKPEAILELLEGSAAFAEGGTAIEKGGVFLLDSVTALLSNEMFRQDGTVDLKAAERIASELSRFAELTDNTVFVSDFIYSDGKIYGELTEAYRKGLAHIDRTLAAACQRVIEVSFSTAIEYKRR